jgi:hypothetical protein
VRRADEAYRCSFGKLVVVARDPQHHLLGRFVAHLLGQDAGFFRSLVPMFWVIEMPHNGHGTFAVGKPPSLIGLAQVRA